MVAAPASVGGKSSPRPPGHLAWYRQVKALSLSTCTLGACTLGARACTCTLGACLLMRWSSPSWQRCRRTPPSWQLCTHARLLRHFPCAQHAHRAFITHLLALCKHCFKQVCAVVFTDLLASSLVPQLQCDLQQQEHWCTTGAWHVELIAAAAAAVSHMNGICQMLHGESGTFNGIIGLTCCLSTYAAPQYMKQLANNRCCTCASRRLRLS